MREEALPALLLCAIFGLALGFASRRVALGAVTALAGAAFALSTLVLPFEWRTSIVIGCWAATIAAAILIYRAHPLKWPAAMVGAVVAGMLVGGLTAATGRAMILTTALPWLLIALPAGWLAGWRKAIVIKVLASWGLAVATLSTGVVLSQGADSASDHLE